MNCIPGTALGYKPSDGFKSGHGTLVYDDMIHSTKLGSVILNQNVISVGTSFDLKDKKFFGKVVKINASKAIINISIPQSEKYLAIDTTLLAKDCGKENIQQYFKLGDIVKIRMLSQINDEIIYCSTLEDDEGVVFSNCSDCFSKLSPLSKDSMFCSNCKNIEKRKCKL